MFRTGTLGPSQTISGNSRWPYDHITFLSPPSPTAQASTIRKCSSVSVYHTLFTAATASTTRQILCLGRSVSGLLSPPAHRGHVVTSENSNSAAYHRTATCKRKNRSKFSLVCHPRGSWCESETIVSVFRCEAQYLYNKTGAYCW